MATFMVTSAADSGAGSLRTTVAAANALAGADEIRFDASVFDGEAADVIRLTSGQVGITDELTIVGGSAGATITGDANDDDVTLPGGITDVDASGSGLLDDNSRIFDARAALTLDGLTLTGGRTDESGGAVRGTDVTLTDSTVSGNSSGGYGGGGGGVFASDLLSVDGSTVSGNRTEALGGGVAGDTVVVTNSFISNNEGGFEYAGGGVFGNVVALENSKITGNHAGNGGGVGAMSSVKVTGSLVGGNTANYGGGGVWSFGDVYVHGSTIDGNDGGSFDGGGGGIDGRGYVSVMRSTISNNTVFGFGGGISGRDGVSLVDSTVAGNVVTPAYGYFQSQGGGVFSLGAVSVTHSTVTGNVATSGYDPASGAGIEGQSVALINSIVSGNATDSVADDVVGALALTGGNILGGDLFDGVNDVGDVTAADVFVATTEIAPGIFAGVLADNGGPTRTVAIRGDGPAAGAADPASATATDQRGFARDDAPDLGAFEAGAGGGLTLVGGPGADELTGGDLADDIRGRGGADTLRGMGGDDLILGEKGRDSVRGGGGDDDARGGAGHDRIWGGGGDDILRGGRGPDRFVFGEGFGDDAILDFDAGAQGGQDRIDLRPLGITAASFATEVEVTPDGGGAIVLVAAQGSIRLDGVPAVAIDATDFLLT